VIHIHRVGFLAAGQTARHSRRIKLTRTLRLALAMLAAGAATAVPAHSSPTASTLEPEALTRARVIRTEVSARYRLVPGRKLVVTEASSTGVVRTFTLVNDWLEPRVVAADNGIYFAICSARAKCPYPARSSAWPALALLPRRQAVELALRTFLETSVSLVVVALPTSEPTWVVFERDDFLAEVEALSVFHHLARPAAVGDAPLRELVRLLTRPRLFRPLPILPPPPGTIYAVQLFTP
jgi:hypothetical protein